MSTVQRTPVGADTPAGDAARRRRGPGARGREGLAGWLFIAPAVLILGTFLLVPVLMAAWVSVSDWTGRGSPFASTVGFVGTDNYRTLLADGGLATQDFGTAMRNNLWYVVIVVPVQTALSLFLAVMVNRRLLRARGAFRTAFYFPSVTSSVAITVVFLFLFTASGAVNRVVGAFGGDGPNWLFDPRGVLHVVLGGLGVERGPDALTGNGFLGITWWQWLAGPSVAMSVSSSWRSSPRPGPSCCCSSRRCRRSPATSRRPRRWTARRPGNGSGGSPCRCCGPPCSRS